MPTIQPAIALWNVPGIARQATFEEPQMAVGILPVVFELVLQSDRLQCAIPRQGVAEQIAVDGAPRAASPDQMARPVAAINDVRAFCRFAFDMPCFVLHDAGAGAFQQPGIELEPPDRMLDAGYGQPQAFQVHLHPVEAQKPVRIDAGIDLEVAHDLRCAQSSGIGADSCPGRSQVAHDLGRSSPRRASAEGTTPGPAPLPLAPA